MLAVGCREEETLILDSGAEYFPIKKGLYHVYSVNEVRYGPGSDPEELNYELMTAVVDSFPSAQDGFTYVIHRSRRMAAGSPWEAVDTWSARKDKSEVIVSEGNTAFVKLRFPVRADFRWDGNAFNSLGEDEYEFKDIRQPMVLDGMTFEKTMTVEQELNDDLIVFRDERKEMYALDVGLVYREIIQLNYCTDDNCLGQQTVEEGIEMRMVIKQYGRY